MKNKFYIILTSIFIFLCSFGVTRAQTAEEEAITNFDSKISVNIDNSVDVTETITYNTGPIERHGIYRDIYPYSSMDYKMSIENISATNENSIPYMFTVSDSGPNIRIKIGDPDKTFSGEKTYIIKYHATQAVAQFENFDEIYWNVTGNEWNIPIYQVSALFTLPSGATRIQTACYYGPKGSTETCKLNSSKDDKYVFDAPTTLNAEENLTGAVGFSKGVVTPYTDAEKTSNFIDKYLSLIIAGILPILTLIFSLLYWYKKGKDPKGAGVIVPQYDAPDGLTPTEVAGIVNQKISSDDISAEIIYLAIKGYVKINQIEEKTLGVFKSTDYELLKLKDFSDVPNDFDKQLLNSLFEANTQTVKLSSLANVFYEKTKIIIGVTLDELLNKGYYKNLSGMKNINGGLLTTIFWALFISFFVNIFSGINFVVAFGAFISVVIYGIISHFFPAKTEKGVATKEYLLGLKDYLQIAEKDRLIFHNAPDKKPEVFEKLLPYAMVLGVANIWAKEFEGIYTTPPSWYSGPNSGTFSAVMFNNSLSNFNSFASSSLNSSPGGSGGGGSSGGGGGGGGGGGW